MSLLRACRIIAVAVTTAAAALVLASPSHAIDTSFRYEINPQHNFGKCLDVAGASVGNTVAVNQFTCNNQTNQRFRFTRVSGNVYTIRAVHSGKCLDVANGSFLNGAVVNQFQCNGQLNQRFRLLDDTPAPGGTSRIQAVHSGKCLDIPGFSNANGIQVQQFTCNGGSNQKFDLLAFAS